MNLQAIPWVALKGRMVSFHTSGVCQVFAAGAPDIPRLRLFHGVPTRA